MLYTIPDYYHEFSCIAGECEDTCCQGWDIEIDKDTFDEYLKVQDQKMKAMLSDNIKKNNMLIIKNIIYKLFTLYKLDFGIVFIRIQLVSGTIL